MKKILLILAIFTVLLGLFVAFSGCSQPAPAELPSPPPASTSEPTPESAPPEPTPELAPEPTSPDEPALLGVQLIELRAPIETITAGEPYKATVTFLAGEEAKILGAYFFWSGEGPFDIDIKEINYGALSSFLVYLRTGNPGSYELECYVTYVEGFEEAAKGVIKESNRVSTNIVVE